MTTPPRDPLGVELRYSPHRPTPPQHAFLLLDDLAVFEAMYGGAAGGGKSDALLMSALRYVHVPGYAALLLRRTFADLNLPGALIDRSKLWLAGTDATWNVQDSRWTFPSGATLSFGYVQHPDDVYRYASAEFQFIGWDEGTQFREADYRFLFSRVRRPKLDDATTDEDRARVEALANVPLRVRMATNPGGRGHAWVKRRFIDRIPAATLDPEDPGYDIADTPARARRRVFIPAKLTDNPHLDQEGYKESLQALDPQRRDQLLNGDWNARPPGAWVYDGDHLDAAFELGADLDRKLIDGTIDPPDGDLLAIGIDWGENTHALIGWPLPGGGVYVAMEVALLGKEPGESTLQIVGGLDDDGDPVNGILQDLVYYATRPRPVRGLRPPMYLAKGADPLRLVADHRFDAAGSQPMKTYMKAVRRRHKRAVQKGVAFGAPAAKSGALANVEQTYKAEAIGYVRRLLKRTAEERELGVIAISEDGCPVLARQLRGLQWKDQDSGLIAKGDDHGPDALVALVSPLAWAARR